MYREDWDFGDYLDYILDIPMFFIERDGRLIPKTGQSFREFLDGGSGRWTPRMEDFELHISTAFPEVRMKQFVEVRGADGGPRSHVLGVPALWKGLLYHTPSRRRARELMEDIEPEEHAELFHAVYEEGLAAMSPAGPVRELAEELLRLSTDGLEALDDGPGDETEYLEPLRRIVSEDRTLADELREDFVELGGDREANVKKWAFF
jgi:glutamate--cysteine ligase